MMGFRAYHPIPPSKTVRQMWRDHVLMRNMRTILFILFLSLCKKEVWRNVRIYSEAEVSGSFEIQSLTRLQSPDQQSRVLSMDFYRVFDAVLG
jgi:hypothetical protein